MEADNARMKSPSDQTLGQEEECNGGGKMALSTGARADRRHGFDCEHDRVERGTVHKGIVPAGTKVTSPFSVLSPKKERFDFAARIFRKMAEGSAGAPEAPEEQEVPAMTQGQQDFLDSELAALGTLTPAELARFQVLRMRPINPAGGKNTFKKPELVEELHYRRDRRHDGSNRSAGSGECPKKLKASFGRLEWGRNDTATPWETTPPASQQQPPILTGPVAS